MSDLQDSLRAWADDDIVPSDLRAECEKAADRLDEDAVEIHRLRAALAEAQERAEGWRTKYHNDKTVWCDAHALALADCKHLAQEAADLRAALAAQAQRCGSLSEIPVDWRHAALRVGEALAGVGPDGYYGFTPSQWAEWALTQVAKRQREGA